MDMIESKLLTGIVG